MTLKEVGPLTKKNKDLQFSLHSLNQRLDELIQALKGEEAGYTLLEVLDPPPGGETSKGFLYPVVKGDTLSLIAHRFGTTEKALVEANRIRDEKIIIPGQTLIIPVLVYRVKKGDTVFLIASSFGITTQGMIRANRLISPLTIIPGQFLALPIPCQIEIPKYPPPIGEVKGVIYSVQPADSIFFIAGRFNVSAQSIIQLNQLEPPFTIFPHEQLIIPVKAIVYQVQSGDNLFNLALRFNSTADVIARFNNITPPFIISKGHWLIIYSPMTST